MGSHRKVAAAIPLSRSWRHFCGGFRRMRAWYAISVFAPAVALILLGVFVPASASPAPTGAYSTPFSPSVPNPTTASAAELQTAGPQNALGPRVSGTLYGPAIAPSTILARAQSWVNEGVPYSQTNYWTDGNGTYRQDCSGYVSMALGLNTGSANNYGLTTETLPEVATVTGGTELASLEALQPGDIVDLTTTHVVLFASWASPGSIANVYEESSPGTAAHYTTISVSYFLSQGFWGYQYNNMVAGPSAPSGLMNVFYRTPTGQVGNDWWTPTSGWVSQTLPGPADVASAPTAIVNSPSLMNVFFQTTSGQLGNDWWTPEGGWISQTLPGPADVASAPTAIANSPSLMNVFFQTTSGQMGNDWWAPSAGWISQSLPGSANVNGTPTAFVMSPSLMNVYYKTSSGQMANDRWALTDGWTSQTLPGPTNVNSAPSAIANSFSLMNVFFQTPGGQMGNDWWAASAGWVSQTLPGPSNVAGGPAAIVNSPSLMNGFFQTPGGQMGNDWWAPSAGWVSQTLPGSSNVASAPTAIVNSP